MSIYHRLEGAAMFFRGDDTLRKNLKVSIHGVIDGGTESVRG
jgi:hypothetical protein